MTSTPLAAPLHPVGDDDLGLVAAARHAREIAELQLVHTVLAWARARRGETDEGVTDLASGIRDIDGLLLVETAPSVCEWDVDDLAAVLGMSSQGGTAYLRRALELAYRLPKLWARVQALEVPVWRAFRVVDLTSRLGLAAATFVDAAIAPVAHSVSWAQLERTCDAAEARYDPDAAAERRAKAADKRSVGVHISDVSIDGLVELSGFLDFPDAADLEAALITGAQRLKDLGSTESRDARRSQALAEMARTQLGLEFADEQTAAASTAATRAGRLVTLFIHLGDDPADPVARLGNTQSPLAVAAVREWCTRPGTKIVVKPVIDLNDQVRVNQYEIPRRIRERVQLRDGTCVFPYCTRAAERTDLDHRTPYKPNGPPGQTGTDNLACLCRRHHRAKTFSDWTYEFTAPGVIDWTSPTGRAYRRDQHGTTPATAR